MNFPKDQYLINCQSHNHWGRIEFQLVNHFIFIDARGSESATICVTPTLLKSKLLSGLWIVTWWVNGRHVSMSAPMASLPCCDDDVTEVSRKMSHVTLCSHTQEKLLSCLREESHSSQQTAPPLSTLHTRPPQPQPWHWAEKAQVTLPALSIVRVTRSFYVTNCRHKCQIWR